MVPSAQQTMQRKPILMPPAMIERVDKIAKARKVSFAKVVRDAVDAFDEADLTAEEENMLEALADHLIDSNKKAIEKIDALIKSLDETHTIIQEASRGEKRHIHRSSP